MSIFPHDKLDWNLGRLELRLDEQPDDAAARLQFAAASFSKARFHGGGEVWFNKALTQARRVLQHDPASPGALVTAGASLVGLGRLEPAARHLDQAVRLAPLRADVHVAMGLYHQASRALGGPDHAHERHQAVRELEMACRLAPDAWEPHYLLGLLLWQRAGDVGGSERLLERSQYHIVRAAQLDPAVELQPALDYHLGITCLHSGRFSEAHKLLARLLDDPEHRARAQYYLGLVSYQLGKYKNAILYLRQHLEDHENPKVHARVGMAYLQLGEVSKAREACNRALALDPTDVQARWTLGCALAEEGRDEDAIRAFKSILEDAPDHAPAFTELVRLRAARREVRWLRGALRAEVGVHDRLPIRAATAPPARALEPTTAWNPRGATRERIGTLLRALDEVDDQALSAILEAMDLSSDEGLRFFLWEAGLNAACGRRARVVARQLEDPGTSFAASAGRAVLALATWVPEPLLVRALQIEEDDLRRAAVDRHGPARDVLAHRRAIDTERREARAWQALLLLSIASHNNRGSRNLLVRWANEADADLADAARAALVMLGDADATAALRKRARLRGAANLVDAMVTQVSPPQARYHPRPVPSDEDARCTTCGRGRQEVEHILAGGDAAVCNLCMTDIARERQSLGVEDPQVRCGLCHRNNVEARAVYRYKEAAVCRTCVEQSLGLTEREEIDRFLATV